MKKGPQGQVRPADAVGCAVKVAKIATGEIEDDGYKQPRKARAGRVGGRRRADSLTPERRSEIALAASSARWKE